MSALPIFTVRVIYRPAVVTVRRTVTGSSLVHIRKEPSLGLVLFVSALPIFTASHPATIVGVHVLNFCVRDGREPERRRWRIQRGHSECSGRQKTSLPRQTLFSPGTANGNRWNLFPITEKASRFRRRLVSALPIFPGSHPPSIVSVHVLNFCVRDGNRWTHMTINTNYSFYKNLVTRGRIELPLPA